MSVSPRCRLWHGVSLRQRDCDDMIKKLLPGVILILLVQCDTKTDQSSTIIEVCGVELMEGQTISDLSTVNLIEGWCRTQAILAYGSQVRAGLIEQGHQPPASLTDQNTECVQTQADVTRTLQMKHEISHLQSEMCPAELKMRIETYR